MHEKFPEAEAELCPLKLWLIVRESHQTRSSSRVQSILKADAREGYQTCRQGPHESVLTYRERFEHVLNVYESTHGAEVHPEDAAVDFLRGLDSARYGNFRINIENDLLMGSIKAPNNVQEMFQLAANFKTTVKNVKMGGVTVFATQRLDDVKPAKSSQKKEKKTGKADKSADKKAWSTAKSTESRSTHKKEAPKCWKCGKEGHKIDSCPFMSPGTDESDYPEGRVNLTRTESSVFMTLASTRTSAEHLAFACPAKLKWYQVLLDYAAEISVVHPKLLRNIERSKCSVSGLSGVGMNLPYQGYLEGFFTCASATNIAASVLCMADVEDMYPVTRVQGERFTVHLPSGDLHFMRTGKLYIADMRQWAQKDFYVLVTTTTDTEKQYTKVEVARARAARELVENAGFPSRQAAIEMIENGDITGVDITSAYLRRSYDIWGEPVASVRGKTTAGKV